MYLLVFKLFLFLSLLQISVSARNLASQEPNQFQLLKYHKGALLSGKISVNLIWYGKFKPSQRAIISDFITSLTHTSPTSKTLHQPSVATWWKTTEKYYKLATPSKNSSPLSLTLGKQKNMQSLLLPPASSSGVSAVALRPGFQHSFNHQSLSTRSLPLFNPLLLAPKKKTTISSYQSPPSLSVYGFQIGGSKPSFTPSTVAFSYPTSPSSVPGDNEVDKAKLAQVAKRLEKTSRYFKRLGSIGFWGQLVSTVVAAVILSFSIVVTGKPTSPATFYATASGIAAAFVSVFWSFGYIRLSERLRRTSIDPAKAPPRADVVKGLRSGIMVNILGMGSALLGMQATVGFLVAKALTTSANPFYQGVSQGYSPVLALDVFLVQASANTLLSHFLGLVCSLELLRSVTVPNSESVVVPKVA